jgi:hypothetical protein
VAYAVDHLPLVPSVYHRPATVLCTLAEAVRVCVITISHLKKHQRHESKGCPSNCHNQDQLTMFLTMMPHTNLYSQGKKPATALPVRRQCRTVCSINELWVGVCPPRPHESHNVVVYRMSSPLSSRSLARVAATVAEPQSRCSGATDVVAHLTLAVFRLI